jgi:hypothetical protein
MEEELHGISLMPNFNFNLDFFRANFGAKFADEMKRLEDSLNRMARQGNLNPVGQLQPPPKPTALTVTANAAGFHAIQIQDNTPATSGRVYHVEWDSSPQFTNPQPVVSNTPYRNHNAFMAGQTAHYRVFASNGYGPPSEPTYFGTESLPTPVKSVSVVVGGTISGPSPLPSTGSGTEPSLLPRGAAGFGFEPERNPLQSKIPE